MWCAGSRSTVLSLLACWARESTLELANLISADGRQGMTGGQGSENADRREWPKITLVTPVFNSVRYIEQTIQSVVSQQYPNLEYFIVDGGSTDGTLDVIRKYERELSGWTSEPDNPIYHAVTRGFHPSSA